MRAIYYPFSKESSTTKILVTDESAKHLQVVRVKLNDEVLVLNGKGQKAFTKVGTLSKNEVELIVETIETDHPLHEINLAIACPKKEAFEDILKMAVELGVQNIYPLTSEYSQYNYQASERVQRILESALIQSNNSFMPLIHPQVNLETFIEKLNTTLYFFNSKPEDCGKSEIISGLKTILIGPEGGFSSLEIAKIMAKSQTFSIHLPTPIMRAPTAVATSIGYLLA